LGWRAQAPNPRKISPEQVRQISDGTFKHIPSLAYQEQEVRNILDAYQQPMEGIATDGRDTTVTSKQILEFHQGLMTGVAPQDVPVGTFRQDSRGVLSYRGAPASECAFLVDKLCEWLNGPEFSPGDDEDLALLLAFIRGTIAHVYLELIHPFGDGNGRVGRMLELAILLNGGLPAPVGLLLSNHYHKTRPEYYADRNRCSLSESLPIRNGRRRRQLRLRFETQPCISR
jgi:Fic family protein